MYHKFFTDSVNLQAVEEKAESGDAIAQFELGIAYFVGNGTRTNIDKAVEWLTRAADNGIIDAYAVLGDIYIDSSLSVYDADKAKEWHLLGIEKGSHDSLLELTMLYMNEYEISPTASAAKNLKYVLNRANEMEEYDVATDIKNFIANKNIK